MAYHYQQDTLCFIRMFTNILLILSFSTLAMAAFLYVFHHFAILADDRHVRGMCAEKKGVHGQKWRRPCE